MPKGEHEVDVLLVDDPAGGERVQMAYLFVGQGEPVEWEPAVAVPVDSGVLCFAAPGAVPGEDALEPLERALADTGAPTWEHAELPGLIAFSAGFGDGVVQVFWGYDADETLACVAIECLPEWQMADPGSPGRGLQHGFLGAAAFGIEWDPRNLVLVPPAANRALAAVERRVFRALSEGRDVELEARPEYGAEDDPVPVRMHLTAGAAGIDEVVEIARPPG